MAENRSRILVVEDEAVNIKMMNAMLKGQYVVNVALDGVQALKRVFAIPKPDLVLLDINLPGLDGYEVCRRLKADPETEDIPVIFITSLSDEEDEKRGLELGGVDYITKPFRPAIVMARIGNHLKLKRHQDLLKSRTTLDGLTGIPNRRGFDEFLRREWGRGGRAQTPLSLIMLDIDQFKAFNDQHGHVAGDECLRRVGQALEVSLERSVDFVARYGGDEFVCILPDTDLDGALKVAERLRVAICGLEVPNSHARAVSHVNVSLGVATILPDPAVSPDRLIEAADRMLYEAKRDGRGCVRGGKVS